VSRDLALSVTISTVLGPLELEDETNGYWLHKESFGTRNVSYRRVEVSGDFTEGTDVDRALRANVTEMLSVYVTGGTAYQFQARLKVLTDALEQLAFTLTRVVGDAQEVWNCVASDYSLETSQELMVARLGLLHAQVQRKPSVVLSQVDVP
jgi:hypothetical protein